MYNVARLILDPAPFRVDTFVHLHVIDPHNSDNEYVTCPKFMYIYDTSLNNEINFEYKFNLFFFLQLPLCDSYQVMYTTNDIMITTCNTHVRMHVVHMCHIPPTLHAI